MKVNVKVGDLGDLIISFTLPKSTKEKNNFIFVTNPIEISFTGHLKVKVVDLEIATIRFAIQKILRSRRLTII